MARVAPDVVVEWSPTTDPFDTPVWVDATDYVRSGDTNRGRSFELNEYTAGSAKVVLDNRTRRFDPDHATGPYYGSILPGKRVRISQGYLYEALRLAPTGYWRLSETSGVFDNLGSGTSIDLSVTGSDITRSQTGAIVGSTDTAIRLNAGGATGNTYLTAAYSATQSVTNTFTFSCWFKGTAAAQHTLWAKGAGTTNPRVAVTATGNVELVQGTFGGTTAARTTGVNVLDGNWHHIVVTKDGTGASNSHIYVDGVEASYSTRNAYTFVNSNHDWWFGAWNFFGVVEDLQGYIDELCVWTSTALTADQVTRLYKAAMNSGEGVLFSGFAEAWPQSWPEAGGGKDAIVELSVTDLFGWVASWLFEYGAYTSEVLDDAPWLLWRMNDKPSVRYGTVIDSSGNQRHGIFDDGGGGDPTLGTSNEGLIAFEGDSAFEWGTSEFSPGVIALPGRTGLTDITVESWVKFGAEELTQPATIWTHLALEDTSGAPAHSGTHHGLRLKARDNPTALQLVYYDGADWVVGSVRGPEVFDGKPHHIAVTQNGTTFAVVLYIDGRVATLTEATLADSPLGNGPGFYVGAEGWVSTSVDRLAPNYESAEAAVQGVAVHSSVLSASRVLAHYKAGAEPWKLDDTGTRVGRVLDWIGWDASDRDLADGISVFDATAIEGAGIVSYLQRLVRSEGGRIFCAADGTPTFTNRHHVFLSTAGSTVQATLTDSPSGADGDDIPYTLSPGLSLAFDRTLVRNRVTARSKQLSVLWESATSIDDIGPQTETLELEEARWWDLMGAAQSFIRKWSTTTTRTRSSLRCRPDRLTTAALRAATWGLLLRLELGHRVSVVRTPATGSAITKTVLVEGIRHEWHDGQFDSWLSVSAGEVDTTTTWVLGTTGLDEARVVW